MQTKSGVRFELRLTGEEQGRASYGIDLGLPDRKVAGSATIEPGSGGIEFAWHGDPPPAWCESAVRAQLRTMFRERASGYPRRVTRWRPAPDGGPRG
jgi:hypothetical protein